MKNEPVLLLLLKTPSTAAAVYTGAISPLASRFSILGRTTAAAVILKTQNYVHRCRGVHKSTLVSGLWSLAS